MSAPDSASDSDSDTPPSPAWRLYRKLPRSWWIGQAVVLGVVALMFAPALPQVWRGGLHPCRALAQRLCADLGAAECETWNTSSCHSLGTTGPAGNSLHGARYVIGHAIVGRLLGWDDAREDNLTCQDYLADGAYPSLITAIRSCTSATRSTR